MTLACGRKFSFAKYFQTFYRLHKPSKAWKSIKRKWRGAFAPNFEGIIGVVKFFSFANETFKASFNFIVATIIKLNDVVVILLLN